MPDSACAVSATSTSSRYPHSTSGCARRKYAGAPAMRDDGGLYAFWRDYPERDVEYIRWYPPTIGHLDPELMWQQLRPVPEQVVAFYVHVPFCKDICPYCPFNKFNFRPDRAERFMTAIAAEMALTSAQPFVREARTIAG